MIDLHCHSNISDGALSPAEVVRLAATNGCQMLALTDHDHTGGLAMAREEAKKHAMRLINGVEISVTWRRRTIHIVGLDFDEHDESLQHLLTNVRQGRMARLYAMAEKLHQKGIEGAYEGALHLAANPEMVSRTHLAEFLVNQGFARNKQQAFKQYLGEGKAAFVHHQWADLAQAVGAINAAGGVAVVAHPMRYDLSATARRNLLEDFIEAGGQAMEIVSGRCQKGEMLSYMALANRYGLCASVGSDFHRPHDYGGVLGACMALPAGIEPVWTRFRAS